MKKHTIILCLIILFALLAAGCQPASSGATAVPTSAVSSAPAATVLQTAALTPAVLPTPFITPSPLPTPSPSPMPSPTPVGVTENKIGFVRKAYTTSGVNYIDIDYVEFLTGNAAIEAAKAHGDAEQDEHGNWYVPNDYYIVNDNTKIRTFPLEDACSIKIVNLTTMQLKKITFAQLRAKGPTFGDGELLMYIDVQQGYVHSLKEQFRP